ncbi:MAG: response regulator [Proteobacteria bacterium]|nr:response regulator [Pseudomonadota bacterium]
MIGKIKILIVDDEKRFLDTLSKRLVMRGFDVTAISNGTDAIETAKNGEFELALVDLKMPGMNGERVLELLKQNDPFIEVVILTGHGSLESSVACGKLGSHGYLQKPCETFELLHILKEAYKERIRKKNKLSEDGIKNLTKVSDENDQLRIIKLLKKADEDEG